MSDSRDLDPRFLGGARAWAAVARAAAVLSVGLGLVTLTKGQALYPYAHAFAEAVLSPDGYVSYPETVWRVMRSTGQLLLVVGLFFAAYGIWQPAFPRARLMVLVAAIRRYPLSLWFALLPIASSLRFFGPLQGEDGPLEWLTALLFLGSGLAAGGLALRERGRDRHLIFGIAAALVVMAMEEISWGQRLFGWETPAAWAALNHQGETNLHNLVGAAARPPLYGIVALGAAMWLAGGLRAAGPAGRWARFAYLPRLAGFAPVLVLVALMAFSKIFYYDESLERLASVLSVFFACHLYRTRTADPGNL